MGRGPWSYIKSCPYCSRSSHQFMHYPVLLFLLILFSFVLTWRHLNILPISMFHISEKKKKNTFSRQIYDIYDLLDMHRYHNLRLMNDFFLPGNLLLVCYSTHTLVHLHVHSVSLQVAWSKVAYHETNWCHNLEEEWSVQYLLRLALGYTDTMASHLKTHADQTLPETIQSTTH